MITKDTLGTGNPDKRFTAISGKTYLDTASGIRYVQTVSPSGNNWIAFESDQFFYPEDSLPVVDGAYGDIVVSLLGTIWRAFQTTLTEQSVPSTPSANTVIQYLFDHQGFSIPHYIDSTGANIEPTRDNFVVVKNVTGSTISKGEVVYVTGAVSNVPTVGKAKADSVNTMPAFGVMFEDTLTGNFGRCMQIGAIEDIDLSAFLDGDLLYVSATVAGEFTKTRPAFPNLAQSIGTVMNNSATVGVLQIFVRVVQGVMDGDALAIGLQFPNTGLSILGNVPGSRTLTIVPNENFTAPRQLRIVLNDATRTLTIPADATISGVNTGDQANITGNAATATALQTSRDIGGSPFNGTLNIDIVQFLTNDEAVDTTCFIIFSNISGTAVIQPKTNTGLLYNAATNAITAATFIGALTGNAATATVLATARNIGGVSFNGSANIVPQTIESADEAADTTCFILFITASGTQQLQPKNNTALTFNSSTGQLGATSILTPTLVTHASTSNSLTFDSTYYGKILLWSPTGAATATLPANTEPVGSWFEVHVLTNQNTTISAATVDTLIATGDLTADSVAFTTANQKIGAVYRFIKATSGSWKATNMSVGCTMTIAT